MSITPERIQTQVEPVNRIGRIVQFPLSRVIIMIVFLLPVSLLHNVLIDYVLSLLEGETLRYLIDLEGAVNFVLLLLTLRLYAKYVERRPAFEISAHGAVTETGGGFLIGGGMVLLAVVVMYAADSYRVVGYDATGTLVHALRLFGLGAFVQEVFFRLIVFRLLEEWLGSWTALVLTALIFGALHLGNENASFLTSALLIPADLILTASFMLTRRIWLVWGIHFGWNFLQDGVFGMPNSGETSLPSWITPEITGPGWLTGGAFGIEASVLGVLLPAAIGLGLLLLAFRRGQFVRPRWIRRKQTAPGLT